MDPINATVSTTVATADNLDDIPEFLRRSSDEPKAAETEANIPSSPAREWRKHLRVHPAADRFPVMGDAELKDLAADIEKHGLRTPVALYSDPELGLCLLDGRHRLDALALLDRELSDEDHDYVGQDDESFDPHAYVISANIKRRHLKPEERADLIIKILAMKPEKSDRQIAKELGFDHKTIGRARAQGVAVGHIPHVEARTDTKGRKQPARCKRTTEKKSGSSTSKVPAQKTGVAWDVESNAEEAKRKAMQCAQSAADAQAVIDAAGMLDEGTVEAVIKVATDAEKACMSGAEAWRAVAESVRR